MLRGKCNTDFCKITECNLQVMQLFCDHLDLLLIWSCRHQNLHLRPRQSPWKIEVPPQPEGYQIQRSTQQPGFPSHYVIALMEGACVGGEEDKFRLLAKTRQSVKSRLIDQEESKHREWGCCCPTMRTLGYEWGDQGSSWGAAVWSLKLLFGSQSRWKENKK